MPKAPNFIKTFIAAPLSADRRFIDLTGQTFTRLTVVSYAHRSYGRSHEWNCICTCGARLAVKGGNLRNGNTKSCGCLHREFMDEKNTVHGESPRGGVTPEFKAYHQAKDRCTNPNYHAYPAYGGRGIEFRFDSVQQFIDHIGRRPTARHTLDRIDVNGHYEAGNVRWVTMHDQNRNRTDHRYITLDGTTKCVADWADALGVSSDMVSDRMVRGWCGPCALTLAKRPGVRGCHHLR